MSREHQEAEIELGDELYELRRRHTALALLAGRYGKALEFIAGHADRTLLGPEHDVGRFHEVGANKAFNQMAAAAKEALNVTPPSWS